VVDPQTLCRTWKPKRHIKLYLQGKKPKGLLDMYFEWYQEQAKEHGLVVEKTSKDKFRIVNGKSIITFDINRGGRFEDAISAALNKPSTKLPEPRVVFTPPKPKPRVWKLTNELNSEAERSAYRRLLWEREHRCTYCWKLLKLSDSTLDHVIPVKRGGKNTPENMVLSCVPCNSEKGDKLCPTTS
jgi:hypothetical protein